MPHKRPRDARFQSHFGSIKTGPNPSLCRKPLLFQSHFGSIKTRSLNEMMFSEWKFQSHFGSIKTLAYRSGIKPISDVSIPLWFD